MGKSIDSRGRAARIARRGENRKRRVLDYASTPSAAATKRGGMDRPRERASYPFAGPKQADADLMARALRLAEKWRGRTAPNPIVGCVITDARGRVLAEGAHRAAGAKHAEIEALGKLGNCAPGATMYVTLEPCTHHGRTPPCVPVVRAAG